MSEWILPTLAGIVAGIAGAMGLGGGSVLLLYLTLFAGVPQMQAQGINLIFFIPNAIIALILHSRSGLVAWREALTCASSGLVGAFIGFSLADRIDSDALGIIFGIFMLILGVRELFFRKQPHS